jgi:hypothetical protein
MAAGITPRKVGANIVFFSNMTLRKHLPAIQGYAPPQNYDTTDLADQKTFPWSYG